MAQNPTRSGGKIVVDEFIQQGVKHVFCVPGESYLDILDALYDVGNRINLVSARQEGGGTYMAEAYAKLTGKVGISLVTRGPGACNASIAVHTAYQDATPIILIVGQVRRDFWGRGSFQELDYTRMFEPMTKWVAQVERTEELPYYLARAFRVAQEGRPGPVVVALPEDMLTEQTDVLNLPVQPIPAQSPMETQLAEMRAILDAAERPFLYLGGGGWTEAAKRGIEDFAKANGLPVACTWRRLDTFDNYHPNFVGEMGPAASAELVQMVKESDVLMAIGNRLGEHPTQGYTLLDHPVPDQKLIHVLQDERDFGRTFHPILAIQSDFEAFAGAVNKTKAVSTSARETRIAEAKNHYEQNIDPANSPKSQLDLGECLVALDNRLPDDAIITTDAGHFSGWVQRFLRIGPKRRFLGPISGAMGFAVPAAVMAKIVHPERMVVATVGDGGFGMTGNEITTAVACGATPIILVFNNSMLGSIRTWQEIEYPGRVTATGLVNPDYTKLAEAHGVFGARVERTEDFMPTFEDAVNSGKPAIIDLAMDPEAVTTRVTLSEIREAAFERKKNS